MMDYEIKIKNISRVFNDSWPANCLKRVLKFGVVTWTYPCDDDVRVLWRVLYRKWQDENWIKFFYKRNSAEISLNWESFHLEIISWVKVQVLNLFEKDKKQCEG